MLRRLRVSTSLQVGAAPTVTSIAYTTGTTGVGVGAAAQTVTISGTNFETGVVVGNFKNANGVADPAYGQGG